VCVCEVVRYCPEETWYEGASASSIRSPVVDEERMRRDRWLMSVACVSFSASTLLIVLTSLPLVLKGSVPDGWRWRSRTTGEPAEPSAPGQWQVGSERAFDVPLDT